MKSTFDIPWRRYALIPELIKRVAAVKNTKFGNTSLQKLVFILQEAYHINCGYDFRLSSCGPFDTQLFSDLALVEHWGCVKILLLSTNGVRCRILPTQNIDRIRDKATEFLDNHDTKKALDSLICKYGTMGSVYLNICATIIYVERELKRKGRTPTLDEICSVVEGINPKFSRQPIAKLMSKIWERRKE